MNTETGLTSTQAQQLLAQFGRNQMAKPTEVKFLAIAKEEVTEPMMLLLMVVGIVYALWGKFEDALTIFVIIFIMISVEVWNEFKAKKAIAALSKLAAPKTKVLRDGKITEVATELVVPGDILILNPGTRIAADSQLITAVSMQIDESSLTGESLPVTKKNGEPILAGTLIVAGEGKANVTATGLQTKFGKISSLAQTIKPPKTPLQLAMKRLSGNLVWVALFFSLSIPLLGLLRGQSFKDMILTGLALSFSVIPEELPFVITLILGLGAYQLSKNRFLIKKLKAAEVLGDTTVILTDKTGTLTESNMRVVAVFPQSAEREIIQAASALLSDSSLFATDQAIRQKAQALQLPGSWGDIVRARSFNDVSKTKAIIQQIGGELHIIISGAPESIFPLTNQDLAAYQRELTKETNQGHRVIAVANKRIMSSDKDQDFAQLEKAVTLVGLISIADPPRSGVREALALTRQAGIRTIMVTGDHPQTALAIATAVDIAADKVMTGDELDALSDQELSKVVQTTAVFARTTPEHKYRLLQALQANGEIVAVTGDGINDVLALKGADIGIAMGIKGTDAAKEAADVVVADDNYTTITAAIFSGRKFYDNLKKSVSYYLSVKVALVLIFLLPVLIGVPFPFAPIQIILLEMFMDLAASSGFAAEPSEKSIYRPVVRTAATGILGKNMLRNIAVSALSLLAAVLIPYFYALRFAPLQAQTFAFSGWVIGHILLAFVSRSENEPLVRLGFFSNRVMTVWGIGALTMLITSIAVPTVGTLLKITSISVYQLLGIGLVAAVAVLWKEIIKISRKKIDNRN